MEITFFNDDAIRTFPCQKMNPPTNICVKRNPLTLCVHIVLKMMQCWQKKTESFNPFPKGKCYRLDQIDRVCRRHFMDFFCMAESLLNREKTL